MIRSTLQGVYDMAAGDTFEGFRLGDLIGRSFRYEGSDGQTHRGTIRAICLPAETNYEPCAVFSSGYSDGHWTRLSRAVANLI